MFSGGFNYPQVNSWQTQDLTDIESIIIRQGDKLDTEYIQKWLKDFSALLETNEPLERFEKSWNILRKKNRND